MRILGMRCDRCGAEVSDPADWAEWGYLSLRDTGDGETALDLCPACLYIVKRELRPEQAS